MQTGLSEMITVSTPVMPIAQDQQGDPVWGPTPFSNSVRADNAPGRRRVFGGHWWWNDSPRILTS